MNLTAYFAILADYNRWANRRLYDAAARLPDPDYRADRGAFFRSVHGTLNHLLVADRIWLQRLTGEGAAPPTLDAIIYVRLPDLTVAREQEDERLAAYVTAQDEAGFAAPVTYRNTQGAEFTQPVGHVLAHLFNHHTHHRGQAHAIITGLGRDMPSLDLIDFLRTNL